MSVLKLLCFFIFTTSTVAFLGTPLKSFTPSTTTNAGSSSNLVMRARVCDLLGKTPNRQAYTVTFSHKRIKRVQHVNLQTKKYFSEDLKRNVKLRLSTKGMKTVKKYGSIDAAAKQLGVDLGQFR